MKQLDFSLLKSYLPDNVFWYTDPRLEGLFTIAVRFKHDYLKQHIQDKYLYLVQDWLPRKTTLEHFDKESLDIQMALNDMWLKVVEDLNDNNMEK